ncbi:MAG: hypothetical protein JWO98_4714 [Frankiales bacterium]|nr:hypothetical protein [Frankiales bacterium]
MSETRAHDLTPDCWCGPEVVSIEPTLTPNGLYPYADPTAHTYITSIDDAGDDTKLCRSCGRHRSQHGGQAQR